MKRHIFFIGIVGHAMRGLALAAKQLGNHVTGLDEEADEGAGTKWLDDHSITWYHKADSSQLDGVDLIIISGGTSDDYPMLTEAKKRGIKVESFAEFLGDITAGQHSIVVAGTHGKTTTTSLIAWLLDSAGRQPDFLVGIRPFNFDSSVRLQDSRVVVIEGDEYKASSLDPKSKAQYYHADTLVLTSVEHDHPDVFPDTASVIKRFQEIAGALPKAGRLIAWAEDANVTLVAGSAKCPVTTYGLTAGDFTARDIAYLPTGLEFDVVTSGEVLGRVALPLYGKHNVLNTLAATVAALQEGLTIDQIIDGAADFQGAFRRFNVLTDPDAKITVIDDYAHHPTEVAATLEAAKLHFAGRRIVAVFRPHTYSRTAALLEEYRQAFNSAGLVYLAEIEAARENGADHTVSSLDITQSLKMPALFVPDRSDLVQRIKRDSKPGDVVVCMTVSGYNQLAEELAQILPA